MTAKQWGEYRKKQLLYLPNAVANKKHARETIGFCKTNAEKLSIAKYWTWENEDSRTAQQSYRSFVLQASDNDTLFHELQKNFPALDLFHGIEMDPVAWVFVGKNSVPSSSMKGRPEHVDDVGASGTVHWQVCGKKLWRLRPCLQAEWPEGATKPSPYEVIEIECKPDSILLVNTSLYYHETKIPCTEDGEGGLSISIAREFYLPTADNLVVKPRMPVCGRLVAPYVSMVSGSFETHHTICAWCRTPTGISTETSQNAVCACLCCMLRRQLKQELSYVLNTSATFFPFVLRRCNEESARNGSSAGKTVSAARTSLKGIRRLILHRPRLHLTSTSS
eukprot:109849-Hanusia_phi.AAC.2